MLARLTRRPFDSPDHIFELKWDGIRALAFVEGGRLRLQDRNLRDITSRFPELAQPCEFMETDGCAFFQATCDHGLEGIVAKDRSSRYLPGKRNSRWLKVKRVRECEFVVAGYTVGGKRTGQFSALLLGLYDEAKRLVFVGSVGVGFSKGDRSQIHGVLKGLHVQECPFDDPPKVQKLLYWCRPELVCGVEYGEFTDDGEAHYARYLSLREDKPARAGPYPWPLFGGKGGLLPLSASRYFVPPTRPRNVSGGLTPGPCQGGGPPLETPSPTDGFLRSRVTGFGRSFRGAGLPLSGVAGEGRVGHEDGVGRSHQATKGPSR